MIKNKNNILFFRIAIITIGIIILIGYLHIGTTKSYDLIKTVRNEQIALAEKLADKYDAAILQRKMKQQQLINKIIPLGKIVVADSVVKDFYQKGNKVFVLLKINNSSQNIFAKLECNKSVIDEYFKLQSNKVFAVFKPDKILFNQPFYEAERKNGVPVILHGRDEILITGNCLQLVEYPTCIADG